MNSSAPRLSRLPLSSHLRHTEGQRRTEACTPLSVRLLAPARYTLTTATVARSRLTAKMREAARRPARLSGIPCMHRRVRTTASTPIRMSEALIPPSLTTDTRLLGLRHQKGGNLCIPLVRQGLCLSRRHHPLQASCPLRRPREMMGGGNKFVSFFACFEFSRCAQSSAFTIISHHQLSSMLHASIQLITYIFASFSTRNLNTHS